VEHTKTGQIPARRVLCILQYVYLSGLGVVEGSREICPIVREEGQYLDRVSTSSRTLSLQATAPGLAHSSELFWGALVNILFVFIDSILLLPCLRSPLFVAQS
jgi:hypothetical protein